MFTTTSRPRQTQSTGSRFQPVADHFRRPERAPRLVAPGSPQEREADRVAELLTRKADGCSGRCGGTCSRCRADAAVRSTPLPPDRRGAPAAPPAVDSALRSSGEPLTSHTRALFERHMGHDFSGVRVHWDGKAAAAAAAVHANAFTVGQDIVFGAGRYAPATSQGQRLLAHELAHVVQHDRAGSSPPALYRQEADGSAPAVAGGGCRKTTSTACPGVKGQFTRIEYFPSMFLVNKGTCDLFVAGLDAAGNVIEPMLEHFQLAPGESGTFRPPAGAEGVAFACLIGCEGVGRLEHPYLCA